MTAHQTFTPSAMTAAELDALTVGREAVFDTLVHRITSAARDGSRPHTLLVAPRGGGKTHTLHVAVQRSLVDASVRNGVLPVLIPEDALAIGSYLDLLVEIARTIDGELGQTARAMRRDDDAVGIEQAVVATAAGRMILLAIENLDRVFDALGQPGQGSLRAWVETSTAIMIFATVPALFAGVSSRSYPWYGSFMVEPLPDLTVEEGAAMLAHSARARGDDELAALVDSPVGHARLEVIHRFTGGLPRLWNILSNCIDVDSLDALVPAVEALLDRLTPYYQQRLWQLPTGEQRLVVELARGWKPCTVSDLAAAVGVSNQSAATALGRLASSRWVTSTKARDGDKRASWYDLTEPLLRYQLQYREEGGKPLRLIVEFLRGFYARDRLLDELAEAIPDSHLEHHLQLALLGGLSSLPQSRDIGRLISGLRLWISEGGTGVADVAIAAEHVAYAASDQVSSRPLPEHLTAIARRAASAAASTQDSFAERLVAGLEVLAGADWDDAGDDAVLWLQLSWGSDVTRYEPRLQRLLGSRRTNEPAVLLRTKAAYRLLASSTPEAALVASDELLDDLAKYETMQPTECGPWIVWAQAAARTKDIPSRRAPHVLAAATGMVFAIKGNDAGWSDVPKLLASIAIDDRDEVAARIILIAAKLDMHPPEEFDPLRFASNEFQALVHHLERQLRSGIDPRQLRPRGPWEPTALGTIGEQTQKTLNRMD